jgi:hypothetical protein
LVAVVGSSENKGTHVSRTRQLRAREKRRKKRRRKTRRKTRRARRRAAVTAAQVG